MCPPRVCGSAACLRAASVCVRGSWGVSELRGCVSKGWWRGGVCVCVRVCARVCAEVCGLCFVCAACVCPLWGGCRLCQCLRGGLCMQVRGFAGCTGQGVCVCAHTNLEAVPRVCMRGGVAGCLHAPCVCVGGIAGGGWGGRAPPRMLCECRRVGGGLPVVLTACVCRLPCVCVCAHPVGAAASQVPPPRLSGTPLGSGGAP